MLKLALKADVGCDWTVTPSLFYQRFKSDDIDAAYLNVGSYQVPANAATQALARFQTSKIVREPMTDTLTVPSLTVNGDLGFADATGVLSGYKRRFDRIQDGTFVNVYYLGLWSYELGAKSRLLDNRLSVSALFHIDWRKTWRCSRNMLRLVSDHQPKSYNVATLWYHP